MSDLSWIKLSLRMFDDEKIRVIESLPESDAILLVWIKLLVLAGKSNADGAIFITPEIQYTEEMLAVMMRCKPNVARLALATLSRFGMIEISQVEDGGAAHIQITNWSKYQNTEGMDRQRMLTQARVSRFRQRKLSVTRNYTAVEDNVTSNVTSNVPVTSESEKKEVSNVTVTRLEERVENREEESESPPNPPEGGVTHALSDQSQAKRILGDLVRKVWGRPVTAADWSNRDRDKQLGEALPIAREAWNDLIWLYTLPEGHRAIAKTGRRQSFDQLLSNLAAEVDKAVLLRRSMASLTGQSVQDKSEPDGWREVAAEIWPGVDYDCSFSVLPHTSRRQILEKITEKNER